MKRLVSGILSVLFLAGALIFGVSARSASDDLDAACDFLISQGLLDSESANGDWFAVALSQLGEGHRLGGYAYFLSQRVRGEIGKNDKIRVALACLAMGIEDGFVLETANDGELIRVSDIIWRLILAVNIGDSELVASLSDELEALALEDGGYALTGDEADADVTAMAIAALKMADREVDGLLELLSSMQDENGGYTSLGAQNAESAAQVVIALKICGIDPQNDPRFIKGGVSVYDAMLSYSCADGGFSHTADGAENRRATVQVALALMACARGAATYLFDGDPVTPEAQEPSVENTVEGESLDYKPIACAVLIVFAAVIFAILALTRRLSAKNALYVAFFTLVALFVIIFTTIQTPEQFYAENPDPIGEDSAVVTFSVIGEGELVAPTEYALRDGESVLDLLLRVAKYNGLRVDVSANYVRGIGELYEFDLGENSGWMFKINGEYPSIGADRVIPKNGDRIEWVYTDRAALGEQ